MSPSVSRTRSGLSLWVLPHRAPEWWCQYIQHHREGCPYMSGQPRRRQQHVARRKLCYVADGQPASGRGESADRDEDRFIYWSFLSPTVGCGSTLAQGDHVPLVEVNGRLRLCISSRSTLCTAQRTDWGPKSSTMSRRV